MRDLLRPLAFALSVVCVSAAVALSSTGGALAQAKQAPASQMAPAPGAPPALKQIALTEKQVEGVLAAAKDMDAITDKLPENVKPDAKTAARSRP